MALSKAHEIVAVITQPDAKHGNAIKAPPIKDAAQYEIRIKPELIIQKSINHPEVLDQLKAIQPDVFCVIAYGRIFRKASLSIPKLFSLNAHGSLLPRYRGATPIQASILAGDTKTGVSIIKMEEGLDTGPIVYGQDIPIGMDESAGSLHDRLADLSAECMLAALKLVESGTASFTSQDNSLASYTTKIYKESGIIDWGQDASQIGRIVRAMTPWPGAWTSISKPDGSLHKRIRVAAAAAYGREMHPYSYGYANQDVDGIFKVECLLGSLDISRVQCEGGKEMKIDEFLRGVGKEYVSGAILGYRS